MGGASHGVVLVPREPDGMVLKSGGHIGYSYTIAGGHRRMAQQFTKGDRVRSEKTVHTAVHKPDALHKA
jgi:hypothetical protein